MSDDNFSASYDARVAAASADQGTDEIAAALADRGIEAAIEQTGGFCMVVYVRPADGRVLAMANDGRYDLYVYPDAEHERDGRMMADYHAETAREIAAIVEEILAEPLYERCAGCHLFVEPNPSHEAEPEAGLAAYLHLHRGDDADEAIEATHEAAPSGERRTLGAWRVSGPPLMRLRFDLDPAPATESERLAGESVRLLGPLGELLAGSSSPWPWTFQHWGPANQNGDAGESILFDGRGEPVAYGMPDGDGAFAASARTLLPQLMNLVADQQAYIRAHEGAVMHPDWETTDDVEKLRSALRWQAKVSQIALERDARKIFVIKDVREAIADREVGPASQVVSVAQVLADYELSDV